MIKTYSYDGVPFKVIEIMAGLFVGRFEVDGKVISTSTYGESEYAYRATRDMILAYSYGKLVLS